MSVAALPSRDGPLRRLSDFLFRRPFFLVSVLILPPLLWLGIVYLGSLFALLAQSFFSIDEFSGLIRYEFTLATYAELFRIANLDIIVRSLLMAATVTLVAAMIAFPIAYYAARYARGKWKALFYLLVMLPLWSSYLVKVYAWKLILAKEGIITWIANKLYLGWVLDLVLSIPVIGGPSLSISYLGTFIVFLYVWLPYMILPTQAALERVPGNLLEASADLGARPRQTFRTVIFPLALPGMVAGSIFTFSLSLGDYIAVQLVGGGEQLLGNVIYNNIAGGGNTPLGAALALISVLIITVYLLLVRRTGALKEL
jgi:putative spermidine/putrescine transport system permease protein